ncbi:MAG: Synechococcus phage Bellamy, partial [Pseudomonadota bacterium]
LELKEELGFDADEFRSAFDCIGVRYKSKKEMSEVIATNNDPFQNPLSDEEVVLRTKKSILGVDIRGPEHIRNGYVPCRVFKSMSWGHLGMTNSEEVYKELEGHCIYQSNTSQLFYDSMDRKDDKKYIEDGMKYVQENHTYINRIKSIMSIL